MTKLCRFNQDTPISQRSEHCLLQQSVSGSEDSQFVGDVMRM